MSYAQIVGGEKSAKVIKTEAEHPDIMLRVFTLPACAMTCPNAKACVAGCYGKKGRMGCPTAHRAYTENLAMVLDGTLWRQLDAELTVLECQAERAHKRLLIRIHAAGDFYSEDYARTWFCAMRMHPKTTFYCYTKMVDMFHGFEDEGILPSNFEYVFSRGGTEDHLIREEDRTSDVYIGACPPGYVDGSGDDYPAANPKVRRIALRYHGPKAYAFTTL